MATIQLNLTTTSTPEKTVKAIEVRNDGSTAAEPA
jgi:hypothetical protein